MEKIISKLSKSSLFRDSFWSLLGNAIGKGLALLSGIAVARFLGSNEYGTYGLIKSTLLSIAIFSSFGLGYTATKFIAENISSNTTIIRKLHNYCTVITISFSAIVSFFVFIFSNQLAIWLRDGELGFIFKWSAIGIVLNALITTQIGELAGFNAYKTIARNNIFSGIITFLCVVPCAYFGGVKFAIIGLIMTLFFNCIINWISIRQLIRKYHTEIRSKDRDLIKGMITFSLPIALQESLYSITSWLGMAMLIKLANFSELGVYSAAQQWMSVMLFIPGALRNVALSHLSRNSTDLYKSNKTTKQLLLINFLSTFIPFICIFLAGSWIANFYGPSYSQLPSVLNICIFTAVVTSLSNILTQELIANNQNWFLFWSRFLRDSLTLVIAFILIKVHWINAAASFALSYLIFQCIYLMLLIKRRRKIYNA